MITEYINKKLQTATYKVLEDKTYFGYIPGIKGVWANSTTLKGCKNELAEVLEEWLVLQIQDKKSVSGLRLNFGRKVSFKNA